LPYRSESAFSFDVKVTRVLAQATTIRRNLVAVRSLVTDTEASDSIRIILVKNQESAISPKFISGRDGKATARPEYTDSVQVSIHNCGKIREIVAAIEYHQQY
jgi:hypothetical protein